MMQESAAKHPGAAHPEGKHPEDKHPQGKHPEIKQSDHGFCVLHLFAKVKKGFNATQLQKIISSLTAPQDVVTQDVATQHATTQIVVIAMLGHESDIGFMVLSPDLNRLLEAKILLAKAKLEWTDSYLSVTEISEYAPRNLDSQQRQDRLYPQLPPEGKTAWCFYPMSKRRGEQHNWYKLPYEKRRDLMYEHGMSGRKFAGRVVQLITASTGLDDYEWGVTLFCQEPSDLKDVVYTLRYDEGSAIYGEFGPFWTGVTKTEEELDDFLEQLAG